MPICRPPLFSNPGREEGGDGFFDSWIPGETCLLAPSKSSQFPSPVLLLIEAYLFPHIKMCHKIQCVYMAICWSFWKSLFRGHCTSNFLPSVWPGFTCQRDLVIFGVDTFLSSRCATVIVFFLQSNTTLGWSSIRRDTILLIAISLSTYILLPLW